MKIDGKKIAGNILEDLKHQVEVCKEKGIIPSLAVILVGDDSASVSFIRQKRLAAETIGATLHLDQLSTTIPNKLLKELIEKYNEEPNIHGIIIQRPLPKDSPIDRNTLLEVSPQKDVDGFVPNSAFHAPVADAVWRILEGVFPQFPQASKRIVIVGRGETAGTPIARLFIQKGLNPTIVHSQTPNPGQVLKKADIIISCVGKHRIIQKELLKPSVMLIGVGMHREEDGKLHGDYEEDEVGDIASFYTPTPGGVGPVNVACLMKNLIKACIIERGGNV